MTGPPYTPSPHVEVLNVLLAMNPGARITAVADHPRARTVFAYDSMPGVRHSIAISDLEMYSLSSKQDVMAVACNVASKLGLSVGEAKFTIPDPEPPPVKVDFAVACPVARELKFRNDGRVQPEGGWAGIVKVERDPFLSKKTERTVQLVEYRFGDTDGRRGPWAIARRRYAFDARRGVVYTDPTIEVEWDMESAEAAAWLRPFIWDPGD